MKSTTILLAASLLAGSLAAQDELQPISGVEDAVISLVEFDKPADLQKVLQAVSKQLPHQPSIVYKPGAERIQIPVMQLQQVRFGDFLKALGELVEVRIKIMNPMPKEGESPLLIVDANPRQFGTAGGADFGGESEYGGLGASSGAPIDFYIGDEEGAGGPGPGPGSGLLSGPNPKRSPGQSTPRANPTPFLAGDPTTAGGVDSASWGGLGLSPTTITKTYAIGSLIDDKESGHPSAEIIDAINLVWSTASVEMPKGENAVRVAMHEPSRLLIIKAPGELQALAGEVIANLTKEHEEHLRHREAQASVETNNREHERELNHLQELHTVTVERLKASQSAEVDKLRATVQELETQSRKLQSQRR